MIKLDTVSFTLLNLPPSKYDVLMSPYGTQGLQAVGPHEDSEKPSWPSLDYARLERFLNRAAEMIFAVLAEEPSVTEVTSNLGMKELVESEVTFGTEITELLAERPATLLYFAERCRLLTLHPTRDQDQQDLVCVWSSVQPSFPRHVLGSRASVSSICVHPEWPNFVIAGCCDGSLNMWDLQEVMFDHPVVVLHDRKLKLRSPTFSTVEGGVSHCSSVVRVLPTSGSQLISVDESGLVLTWSLVHMPRSSQVGSSAMTYRLVRSHAMQLRSVSVEEAVVTDAARFGDRLLVALDTGDVMSVALLVKHANRMYLADDDCSVPGDTIITVSPYGRQFLVQDGSGNMRVHHETRSLAVWTSPSHELGESAPNTASWGAAGLTCLLPGHVQLWHVPSPRPAVTCATSADIVSLEASPFTPFTAQIAASTRDGKVCVINVQPKWHPDQTLMLR
ncbi:hypothetical protein B566_EDAN007072 [Ephemera danica]|nr:hypothetical protein B566_EDAN007072 [Ephemera danica]